IESRSQGSPLAIGEYVRAMLDAGLLRPSWGRWIINTDGLENLKLPTNVLQLVIKRLSDLSPGTRAVLESAAVLGSRFRPEALARVSGSPEASIHAAIAEAVLAHLIDRGDQGDYFFIHDRVQEALLTALPPDSLRTQHQRAAEALDRPGELEQIYELARHYLQGETGKHPKRIHEVCLLSGTRALENFASEEAYFFLSQAWKFAGAAGITPELSLLQMLGSVCFWTGRWTEAIMHLKEVIARAEDPIQRARIRNQLARILAADSQTGLARSEIEKAYQELGEQAPNNSLIQWIRILADWAWGVALVSLGIGFGSSRGKKREANQVLVHLNEQMGILDSHYLRLLQCLQSALLSYRRSHLLGPSRELVSFYAGYAMLLAQLKFRKASERYSAQAHSLAAQPGDPFLITHELAFDGIRQKFLGEESLCEKKLVNVLTENQAWMAAGDLIDASSALMLSLLSRGYASECLKYGKSAASKLQTISGQSAQMYSFYFSFHYSLCLAADGLLGKNADGIECLKKHDALGNHAPLAGAIHASCLLFWQLEQGEFGKPMDDAIALFKSFPITPIAAPPHVYDFYVQQAYARLAQHENRKDSADAASLSRFRTALSELRITAKVPLFLCHRFILEAALLRIEGKPEAAFGFLDRAEKLAMTVDVPIACFDIAVERARLYSGLAKERASRHQADLALALALKHHWSGRVRRIRSEFSASDSPVSVTGSLAVRAQQSSTIAGYTSQHQRQLDALLQLSLASSQVFDPDVQAKVALREIVKLLGAERAFLFLFQAGEKNTLVMSAGQDSEGRELHSLGGYSSTVVESVRNSKRALVVSGTEQGAILGSESAVAYDLRSIMAAPLLVRDTLIGVVYLDNRLAKGVFTGDDVGILQALASHIAIAIETARATQVEMERKSFEKDLEVTGAVQSLLLPGKDTFHSPEIGMAAFYRPASKSGGDWWWYDVRADGKILILLGDVTGHGPGSAMMTTAVVSSYSTLQAIHHSTEDIAGTLKIMGENLRKLTGGSYLMSMSVIEIDPRNARLRWWAAGSPPFFILGADGKTETVLEQSSPLGLAEAGVKEVVRPLRQGDRLFLFTDGAY
ncbi:MAG: SpoIIE family protein phosphatase, partial [Bdellovibrionota bacterium]